MLKRPSTMYMIVRIGEAMDHTHPHLKVGQYKFRRAQEFTCLGSLMRLKNYELTKIKASLQSGYS